MKNQKGITPEVIAQVIKTTCVDQMGAKNKPEGWELNSIAKAVHDYCKKYKIDPSLCIAQGIAESHFAMNPASGRSRIHRNIFNWLNTDDGSNHTFKTFEAGVEQYCKTMRREYFWPDFKDPDTTPEGYVSFEMMQKHDFRRPIGGRYASAENYTRNVGTIVKRVRNLIVKYGGKDA